MEQDIDVSNNSSVLWIMVRSDRKCTVSRSGSQTTLWLLSRTFNRTYNSLILMVSTRLKSQTPMDGGAYSCQTQPKCLVYAFGCTEQISTVSRVWFTNYPLAAIKQGNSMLKYTMINSLENMMATTCTRNSFRCWPWQFSLNLLWHVYAYHVDEILNIISRQLEANFFPYQMN